MDDATVRALLRAACHAPAAMNRQPWLFSVVQDKEQLKRLSDRDAGLGTCPIGFAVPVLNAEGWSR